MGHPVAKTTHMSALTALCAGRCDAGIEIRVSRSANAYTVDVTADPVRPMVLHWAVNEWQLPPQDSWPSGTNQVTWSLGPASISSFTWCDGGPI